MFTENGWYWWWYDSGLASLEQKRLAYLLLVSLVGFYFTVSDSQNNPPSLLFYCLFWIRYYSSPVFWREKLNYLLYTLQQVPREYNINQLVS